MLKIAYTPAYAHALSEGHRFPMIKYELIPEQLLYEGTITQANIFTPTACPHEIVLKTHTKDYLDKLIRQQLSATEQRRIGFPQSPALTERELIIAKGTIDCCLYAMQYGAALNAAGGTHHAFTDRGEGFCLLNDFGIAVNYLLDNTLAKKIAIIDLDVHQGNGTASIFCNNEQVFTLSMHGRHNYPFHKEISDWDIPLEDGTTGAVYLNLLAQALVVIKEQVQPDFICYLSGVDVLDTDKFGKLQLSLEDCKQRDRMVLNFCKTNKIPVAIAMGGGYSADVKIIVEAHCNTFREARDIFG